MNAIEAEPELYVPKPGSIPWRVLTFLLANPNEELTRGDVAVRFNCIGGGTDAILQLAVARGCLKRSRNSKGEMIWLLGLVKRFRLDPDPNANDSEQVKLLEDAVQPEKAASPAPATPAPTPVAASAPAPVTHRAIKVVEPLAKWTANQKPAGPAPFPGETAARTAPKAITVAAPAPAPTVAPSASTFRLPASTTFNANQALHASLAEELQDVLVAGYDKSGRLIIRSSRMTCAEAAFLAQKMLGWALSGGEQAMNSGV